MTSKFSRAALVAGIAIGAGGLVAAPAEAANGIATANYYVNNPAIGAASDITPESAVVSGSVDTGGSPESLLPVPSAGLTWNATGGVVITSEKWDDGTDSPATTSGDFAPIDGLPVSGSNSDIGVTITDAPITNGGVSDPGIGANSGKPEPVSNGGADNYSAVVFQYDPVSDYDAADGTPGVLVDSAQAIEVPTTTGLSTVKATIGAFGQAAQTNSGADPLKPGTKYYYWIQQEPGETDDATNVNVSAWTANTSGTPAAPANNSYKCYPNAAIVADPTLKSYLTPGAVVNYGGQSLPAAQQGSCVYYYGNTGGALYYYSPNGTFTTPKLGTVKLAGKATVSGSRVTLGVTDSSAYKASGKIELTVGGKLAGTARFNLQPKTKGSAKVTLTARGKAALGKGARVKVAPASEVAAVASVSNWNQPLVGKSVKL